MVIKNIVHQRSLRDTGMFQEHIRDCEELLEDLSKKYDIEY